MSAIGRQRLYTSLASRHRLLKRSRPCLPAAPVRAAIAPFSLAAAASWESAPMPFPSLTITAKDGIKASGSFAKAQAEFLHPDQDLVKELDGILRERRVGLVAHYYMDPELQGTLSALSWPHVFVADSLAMGEAAVKMAASGNVSAIICMGVDFMSESVRASLNTNGYQHIPVYRLSEAKIGCSLAESAEKIAYTAWLTQAARTPTSLHLIYINTSLVTKAHCQEILPTITCTSSNVLQTIFQAFAQIPELHLWYGPDTYMGENLHNLLSRLSNLPEDQIRAIHPAHTHTSLRDLLPRFHYFEQGNCVVHHLFGSDVVSRVRADYADAYHTAHLEVPGEMFELAMQAQEQSRGVVGSTSNILNFILSKTREAAAAAGRANGLTGLGNAQGKRLRFVLGTEAGMVTSIVRGVEKVRRRESEIGALILQDTSVPADLQVEVIFPVANDAISPTVEGTAEEGEVLMVVPGVRGGEGCSTSGGCATCPFMKMNSLDSLLDVLNRCPVDAATEIPADLKPYLPPERSIQLPSGRSISDVGTLPIIHMRQFMKDGKLGQDLVDDVRGRPASLPLSEMARIDPRMKRALC